MTFFVRVSVLLRFLICSVLGSTLFFIKIFENLTNLDLVLEGNYILYSDGNKDDECKEKSSSSGSYNDTPSSATNDNSGNNSEESRRNIPFPYFQETPASNIPSNWGPDVLGILFPSSNKPWVEEKKELEELNIPKSGKNDDDDDESNNGNGSSGMSGGASGSESNNAGSSSAEGGTSNSSSNSLPSTIDFVLEQQECEMPSLFDLDGE